MIFHTLYTSSRESCSRIEGTKIGHSEPGNGAGRRHWEYLGIFYPGEVKRPPVMT